jgi:hypothetical protein
MKAAHRLIIARIVRVILAILAFIGFEGMLAGISFNLPVVYFSLACIAFGGGTMTVLYFNLFYIPRLDNEAFEERWNDPAYVAYMAQYK